ncbi:MAG: hypothetical protein NC433_04935 [Clostridiales bacterium]|nr:hypothetical protein [Clostridiales bacterium]
MKEQIIDLSIYQIDNEAEQKCKEKFINFFYLLHFWMKAIEEGRDISSFFIDNGYNQAAIYGTGFLGNHLMTQLENSSFPVIYTIDKNIIRYNNAEHDLMNDISNIPEADVIVVTPIMEYKSIKEKLEKLTSSKIVSLEEVILSL